MRSDRSISPSTSIRSFSSRHSDDDYDSDNTTRYEGLTEEELNEIWERRNLAYFDRRQRLLAEERERQQQQRQQQGQQQQGQQQGGLSGGGDNSVAHNNSSSGSNNLNGSVGTWSEGSSSSSSSSSGQQQQRQRQPLTRPPAGFICAADDPTWQEFVSHNVMGTSYDPERAQREPAYHNAWVSCERLVNMHRSGATSGNFIPTNPRLAALLEHRRLEVAHERYEEREEALRREQQELQQQQQAVQALAQEGTVQQNGASQQPSPFAASSVAAQQAAEYERLNQAHRLQQQQQQQQQSVAHAQGGNNSINLKKSSTTENTSSTTREKNLRRRPDTNNSYYMGLPFQHPSQQLIKPVNCGRCNIQLYTFPLAKRFFCQMCGCVSDVPQAQGQEEQSDLEARLEEKMQDVEDLGDCNQM